jgi:hypothetical protein
MLSGRCNKSDPGPLLVNTLQGPKAAVRPRGCECLLQNIECPKRTVSLGQIEPPDGRPDPGLAVAERAIANPSVAEIQTEALPAGDFQCHNPKLVNDPRPDVRLR